MQKFYWQTATVHDIALHIQQAPQNTVKQQVNYYKLTQNQAMIDKIARAKKMVLYWKLLEKVEALRKELYA